MSWVHHQLSLSVGCRGFPLKTHCLNLNQHSMINIHSISIYVTWPEYQQPNRVTWPALISIISPPYAAKNNTKRDIRRYTRYKALLISQVHFSPHNTGMTPIAHPSGRSLGILRVLEVCPKFCNIPIFIAKRRYINQKTRNSCIKQNPKICQTNIKNELPRGRSLHN